MVMISKTSLENNHLRINFVTIYFAISLCCSHSIMLAKYDITIDRCACRWIKFKMHAARAARLLSTIRPIKLSICGVVMWLDLCLQRI